MTRTTTPHEVRDALLGKREIALLDVREEDPFAQEHPLFAAHLSLSRIELDIFNRIPRRDTQIVIYDDGEGLAARAAQKIEELGYSDVSLLDQGLQGWKDAGYEIFRDVNVPSKAFGELVEARRHTPSLSAGEVQALLDKKTKLVVLDARPFEEYHTMSIPTGINVPGGELVYRVGDMAPEPETIVIVNCAGRTRSLIGAQSLVNAGVSNPVYALRNGTIGWTLARQQLEHGQERKFGDVNPEKARDAALAARSLAERAGVRHISHAEFGALSAVPSRTTYRFDVRTKEEYEAAHLDGFRHAPGGQLVQETDVYAPVQGSLIVLVDDDGVRANMTASWLAQMNREVCVLVSGLSEGAIAHGPEKPNGAPAPAVVEISPQALHTLLQDNLQAQQIAVIDVAPNAAYAKGHIPGAWFAIRSDLPEAIKKLPANIHSYVAVCRTSALSRFVAPELAALTGKPVSVLTGGTFGWAEAGFDVEQGNMRLASPLIDRYRRPYEGTDNPESAMQAYLDWEFGLVEQLERDGTHGFFVI